MNKTNNLEKISYAVVGLVALCSFALSFNNIENVAAENGYDDLAFMVPFIIDGALIAFAVVSLNLATNFNKENKVIKLLIGLFVFVSVIFNYLDAQNNIVGIGLAIVIPFALFFAFETIIYQIKIRIENTEENEVEKLIATVDKIKLELSEKNNEIETLNRIISELKEVPKIPDNLNPLGYNFILFLAGMVTKETLIDEYGVSKNWLGRMENKLLIDSELEETN